MVAEGVEIEIRGDAKLKTSLGCDGAQGYLFSRPLGADGLRRLGRRRAAPRTSPLRPEAPDATTADLFDALPVEG